MSGPSIKQRALKGATWTALGSNLAQVLAFAFFIAISRVVGPEAFGVIAVCLLLIEFARSLTSESVVINLVASGKFDREPFNAAFILSGSLAILLAIALAISAPLAASGFGIPSLTQILPLIAPLLALNALIRLFEAEAMLRLEFRALTVRSICAVLIGGLAGVAAAYAGAGIQALIIQQWVSAITSLALLALLARWRPGLRASWPVLADLARKSAALTPASAITSFRQSLDGLAVAALSGATAAGFYNLAKRTRLALQLGMNTSVGIVSLPSFGMIKHDRARLASGVHQAVRLTAISAFPVFLGVAAVAPELINVFLGPLWRPAILPLQLLMFAGAFTITTRFYENLLIVIERRGTVVAVNAFTLGILILLILAFGSLGPVAIAASVLAVCVIQNIIGFYNASRSAPLKLRDYLTSVWLPMAICFAMIAGIAMLRAAHFSDGLPGIVALALFVMAGAGFYLAAAWALARRAFVAVIDAVRLILSASPAKS